MELANYDNFVPVVTAKSILDEGIWCFQPVEKTPNHLVLASRKSAGSTPVQMAVEEDSSRIASM